MSILQPPHPRREATVVDAAWRVVSLACIIRDTSDPKTKREAMRLLDEATRGIVAECIVIAVEDSGREGHNGGTP